MKTLNSNLKDSDTCSDSIKPIDIIVDDSDQNNEIVKL